ncbi:MAG: hypothetical protein JXN60_01265 [Lentisphaerae bacterium]|nr:hypothetical protein [Lentisphaerota bacterium]
MRTVKWSDENIVYIAIGIIVVTIWVIALVFADFNTRSDPYKYVRFAQTLADGQFYIADTAHNIIPDKTNKK